MRSILQTNKDMRTLMRPLKKCGRKWEQRVRGEQRRTVMNDEKRIESRQIERRQPLIWLGIGRNHDNRPILLITSVCRRRLSPFFRADVCQLRLIELYMTETHIAVLVASLSMLCRSLLCVPIKSSLKTLLSSWFYVSSPPPHRINLADIVKAYAQRFQ